MIHYIHHKYPYELTELVAYELLDSWPDLSVRRQSDNKLMACVRTKKRIGSTEPITTLYISKGYSWDGPSGPAIDTPDWIKASLVHDALYQLIRENRSILDTSITSQLRLSADRTMLDLLSATTMPPFRRAYS